MHSLIYLVVGNSPLGQWITYGLYPSVVVLFFWVSIKKVFLPKLNTIKTQSFPQAFFEINRLFFNLYKLPTYPISNNNVLYKLITIKALENL
jgi:hypothetical protein